MLYNHVPMSTATIIEELKRQRQRLDNAISALEAGPSSVRKKVKNGRRKHNRLSVEARKRISKAAKARWAKAKRAGRNSL